MAKNVRKRARWYLPLILSIAIVAAVAVYYVYNTFVNPLPGSVTVTGTVTLNGEGVVPTNITFTCQDSGHDFTSQVLGGNSGTYNVTLLNGHPYKVVIAWSSGTVDGRLDKGIFYLSSPELLLERNYTS